MKFLLKYDEYMKDYAKVRKWHDRMIAFDEISFYAEILDEFRKRAHKNHRDLLI